MTCHPTLSDLEASAVAPSVPLGAALVVSLALGVALAAGGCERRELDLYQACRPTSPACAEGLSCEDISGGGSSQHICTTPCAATVCSESYDSAWLLAQGVGDCLGAEFAGDCSDDGCCLLREAAGRNEQACASGTEYRFSGVCAPPGTTSGGSVDGGVSEDVGVADAGLDLSPEQL